MDMDIAGHIRIVSFGQDGHARFAFDPANLQTGQLADGTGSI